MLNEKIKYTTQTKHTYHFKYPTTRLYELKDLEDVAIKTLKKQGFDIRKIYLDDEGPQIHSGHFINKSEELFGIENIPPTKEKLIQEINKILNSFEKLAEELRKE